MNIGFVGLGKLGLPVAVALSTQHRVFGYDVSPDLMRKRKYAHKELGPFLEDDFQKYLDDADLAFVPLSELMGKCEIVFVAVQTPHLPLYEGITRIPDQREDFDYHHLESAMREIARLSHQGQVIALISTVLPGTMRKRVLPLLKGRASLVYNPFFIAMGTVMHDFYNPEFVLLGSDDPSALAKIETFYKGFYVRIAGPNTKWWDGDCSHPLIHKVGIESAELAKVAYNTFIGMKITYANMLMEICHKIPGCRIDDVMGVIKSAKNRLISQSYLTPGMGDGGGCHPRDGIAMSWLAQKLDLSHDLLTDIMLARESQAEWLVNLMISYDLPKVILGKSFKPETNITVGSSSILCGNLLTEKGVKFEMWDPYVDGDKFDLPKGVYLIGTKHQLFAKLRFPEGSVVLDPHRYIPDQTGVKVIYVGNGPVLSAI